MSKQLFRMTPRSIGAIAVVLSLIGILMVSTPALAQTGTGVIRGVVRDANQAVVPGAIVTITNERTGVQQKTQTNAEGIYYFGAVPIGPYTLVRRSRWVQEMVNEVCSFKSARPQRWMSPSNLGNVETVVEVVGAAPPSPPRAQKSPT